MLEFLSQLTESLADTFINPQKRVFIGYLITAWVIALVWLLVMQGKTIKQGLHQIFSKQVWLSQSARADYLLILLNRVVMLLVSPLLLSQLAVATLVFETMQHATVPGIGIGWPLWAINLLFTLTLFLLDDASRYLVHRWMHTSKILWRFHRVHHTATNLTPLTIFRTHPVEGVLFGIRTALVQGLSIGSFIFLFGDRVDLLTVLGANLFIFVFNVCGANLRHSNIPLFYPRAVERWLMSPAQHHIHHSIDPIHYNTNYGVFLSIWDRLGGSLHHSEPNTELTFGVDDQGGEEEHKIKTLYLKPFKDSARILLRGKMGKVSEPKSEQRSTA